jgi:putative tryptophan/tyrosine transport system substrate-binding protein
MRRRDFIQAITIAAAVWPLAARAQQAGKLPTIGFLGADAALYSPWTAAFVERLRQLGWTDGQTVKVEYQWSNGRSERIAEIAAAFVRQKVDVIVTYGSAVAAVKQATTITPIVFAIAVDPVGGGLVASLARPGGNVTGLSGQQSDLVGKRIEFLHEVIPKLHRLAYLADAGYRESVSEAEDVSAAARTLGLEVVPMEVRQAEDIPAAFAALGAHADAQADAVYIVSDALLAANRTRIITFALSQRLPTIFSYRDYAKAGGLMSYGPNFVDMFRRAADIVDKILRGTKPADIPVEQPTKFELVINLTAAKALDLKIPASILSLADELIE